MNTEKFILITSIFYEKGNFFKKNKISVEKASEIAGLHLKEFTDLLYKK